MLNRVLELNELRLKEVALIFILTISCYNCLHIQVPKLSNGGLVSLHSNDLLSAHMEQLGIDAASHRMLIAAEFR